MTITNGYCTLNELRGRILDKRSYTAATLSFTASTKTIADTRSGLRLFNSDAIIQVSGSTSNDGYYTVTTGDTPDSIVTSEALTDEVAGETITITDVSDPIDDTILESMVTAVSRAIDLHCARRFFTTDEDETRYFSAEWPGVLATPLDIVSITTLKTDSDGDRTYENTWTVSTDYDLWPYNATLDSWPYQEIRTTPQGNYTFPIGSKSVQIIGKFGWSTCPTAAKEACLLLCEQTFRRKDAIFGVLATATGEAMQVIASSLSEDPTLQLLLAPYVRVSAYG